MDADRIFEDSSLCVVGNINRDIKTARFHASEHLFTDGETSVDSMVETIGGGGANSAFAAASLGARVAFHGKVGADALADRLERTLHRHGLAPHLSRTSDHATGTSIALSFDSGHRHFISCLPASQALEFRDLNLEAINGYRHLLRADVWFSEALLFGGNKELFQVARHIGCPVSLDLNWDPFWGRADVAVVKTRKQAVREALPWVDLAHGNVRELMEFADAADLDIALRSIIDWGAKAVAVHLGARGAGYYRDGELIVAPPSPVSSQVNTTGTGDVLSVCLMLLHHREDIPVLERLKIANDIVAEFIEGRRTLIPALAD